MVHVIPLYFKLLKLGSCCAPHWASIDTMSQMLPGVQCPHCPLHAVREVVACPCHSLGLGERCIQCGNASSCLTGQALQQHFCQYTAGADRPVCLRSPCRHSNLSRYSDLSSGIRKTSLTHLVSCSRHGGMADSSTRAACQHLHTTFESCQRIEFLKAC